MINDVLELVILAVVSPIVTAGTVSAMQVAATSVGITARVFRDLGCLPLMMCGR